MSQTAVIAQDGEARVRLADQSLPTGTAHRPLYIHLPEAIMSDHYEGIVSKNDESFTRDTSFFGVNVSPHVSTATDLSVRALVATSAGWFKPLPEHHPMQATHFMGQLEDGSWSEDRPQRVAVANPVMEVGEVYYVVHSADASIGYGAKVQCVKPETDDEFAAVVLVDGRGSALGASERRLPGDVVYLKIALPTGNPLHVAEVDASWDELDPNVGDALVQESARRQYRDAIVLETLSANPHRPTRVPLTELETTKPYLMRNLDHRRNTDVRLGTILPETWIIGRIHSSGAVMDVNVIERIDNGVVTVVRRSESAVIHEDVMMVDAEIPFVAYELNRAWEQKVKGAPGDNLIVKERVVNKANEVINGMAERLEKMNEALNELAEESDWCSEFEDSVIPLGFEGREGHGNTDYVVTVEVEFTYSEEELGSSDSSRMEEITGFSNISSINVEASGTAYINVRTNAPRNAGENGDLSDHISAEDVESEMNNSYVSVDGWSVSDWEFAD